MRLTPIEFYEYIIRDETPYKKYKNMVAAFIQTQPAFYVFTTIQIWFSIWQGNKTKGTVKSTKNTTIQNLAIGLWWEV